MTRAQCWKRLIERRFRPDWAASGTRTPRSRACAVLLCALRGVLEFLRRTGSRGARQARTTAMLLPLAQAPASAASARGQTARNGIPIALVRQARMTLARPQRSEQASGQVHCLPRDEPASFTGYPERKPLWVSPPRGRGSWGDRRRSACGHFKRRRLGRLGTMGRNES